LHDGRLASILPYPGSLPTLSPSHLVMMGAVDRNGKIAAIIDIRISLLALIDNG
jgi:hypothetical protein